VFIAELLQDVLDHSLGVVAAMRPSFDKLTMTRGSSDKRAMTNGAAQVVGSDDALTQSEYWKHIRGFLRPGDVLVVEDGTASSALSEMKLPDDITVVTQAFIYCSIGYATAALLGAILASPGRRHILLTGDGSLQLTVQELSTIMRHELKPYIFVVNNDGYTVERAVLGKDAKYNDIANWRYTELPKVFSRNGNAETYVVQTSNELQNALAAPHSGMVFVEAVTNKDDAPLTLILGGHAIAATDYGPRGPQNAPNAQIPLPEAVAARLKAAGIA